jgi:uncharacterized protein
MKVRLDHIRDITRELTFTEPVASFPVLVEMVTSGECAFAGPVQATLTAGREMDHYRVEGTVTVPLQQTCSRCLAGFEKQLSSRFTIFFREGTPQVGDEEEVELAEQDLVSAVFSGDEIDLLPEIGEQVALAVPLKPLCSEQCKGLCPLCGADLNTAECGCSREPVNLKFAALKDFKVQR